eukprot:TRINITY_DN32390_c0_g1_i5.p1 TRINITY_DN32390_c0_g1~~TRINITY_DN32390_c0_g1_i5.p1  ORF type:complete len:136 (-),score=12.79 TRINITY_DN32390_c0_g1_i5:198-605(-)
MCIRDSDSDSDLELLEVDSPDAHHPPSSFPGLNPSTRSLPPSSRSAAPQPSTRRVPGHLSTRDRFRLNRGYVPNQITDTVRAWSSGVHAGNQLDIALRHHSDWLRNLKMRVDSTQSRTSQSRTSRSLHTAPPNYR